MILRLRSRLFCFEFEDSTHRGPIWTSRGRFIRDKDWKYYEAGATALGLKTLVDVAERFNEYSLSTGGSVAGTLSRS